MQCRLPGDRVCVAGSGTLLQWRGALLAAFMALAPTPTQAQAAWPQRAVRIVLPFSAGGTTDVPGRILAQRLAEELGQAVIVDNKPGAGSTIGTEFVARAKPDGYTLLLMSPAHVIGPSLYPSIAYNAVADFAPITRIALGAYVMVAHPGLAVSTVSELIARARAEPGRIDFVSSGNGSTQHLVGALFASMAGVELNHVPYRGSGPATQDLIAGLVKLGFPGTPIAIPLVKSGRLRALAVTTPRRLPELPDVPTLAEAGVPGYEATVWLGLLAPVGTPRDIIERLRLAVARALGSPEVERQIAVTGMEVSLTTPEEMGEFLRRELDKWGRIARDSGARVN